MEYFKSIKRKKCKLWIIFIVVGLLLIIFSTSFFVVKEKRRRQINDIEKKKIDKFFDKKSENSNYIDNKQDSDEYIAVLEIPSINLKKGIVSISSNKNNVNKNVYMLKETILPNDNNTSHIILASHSGNSSISFFKDLHKVRKKDVIYFYYNNYKYVYKVYDIYEVKKTGNIFLNSSNDSDITLITCKGNLKIQIVVKGILIDSIFQIR